MPRMRWTVPFGICRAVTDRSWRNDRIAAMEVIGESTAVSSPLRAGRVPAPPECRGQHRQNGSCSSAAGRERPQPADLGGALGGVLRLGVVARRGPQQREGLPGGTGVRGQQRRDQVGDSAVELLARDGGGRQPGRPTRATPTLPPPGPPPPPAPAARAGSSFPPGPYCPPPPPRGCAAVR